MYSTTLNCFLQTHAEIGDYTEFLRKHQLAEHRLDCKNWDLGKIAFNLGDGNLLDMGCMDSFILHNASKIGYKGLKYGIDLIDPRGQNVPGCQFFQGDLMHTPFQSGLFQYLTCLSVIEHGVDYNAFASECSRLLASGGKLFLTYDYWDPKVSTKGMPLYGLEWNVLCKSEVLQVVDACSKNGMELGSEIDWKTTDQVIRPGYMSPYPGIAYTFGILMFVKK
jgi:SAM-dependent methyltransferase